MILTSLGTWGLPQMIQKFYAIKDEKAVHTGTIIYLVCHCSIRRMLFPGWLQPDLRCKRSSGWNGKIRHHHSYYAVPLPDILIGIVIVLVLSASMSTLSSLVLTSSSTLTLDFIPLFVKKMNEKNSS